MSTVAPTLVTLVVAAFKIDFKPVFCIQYVTMDRKFEFLSRPEVDKRTLSVRLLSQVLEGLQFLHSKDISNSFECTCMVI